MTVSTFKVIVTDLRDDGAGWTVEDIQVALRSAYSYATREGVGFSVVKQADDR